ncbi:hypothetical protein GCM10011571_33420 [Marinithermofilum abyssi]|uniref:Uncharacterized protein n=1 Tax=Marinithermofilum abyssi TaxID=1571185 RepID=A0A8J2VKR5_9BACL|nr:hypothetical protein [Marinithermofilum abyssi]GGE28640.1 hypothetical protein GCM10011571_33420 [Marinithermofilum abyssi]
MGDFLQWILKNAFFLLFGYKALLSWRENDVQGMLWWIGSGLVIGLIILQWDAIQTLSDLLWNLIKQSLCKKGYLTEGCSQ